MTYEQVLQTLEQWDRQLDFPLHLIACGDTALTLLQITPSTSEVVFFMPVAEEHPRLINFLSGQGYAQHAQGFRLPDEPDVWYRFTPDKRVLIHELSECPLAMDDSQEIKRWTHLHVGILNLTDLIITQLFQGADVDIDNCIAVFKTWQVDAEDLLNRYAQALECVRHPDQKLHTFMAFIEKLVSQQLVSDDFLKKVVQEKGSLLKKHHDSSPISC